MRNIPGRPEWLILSWLDMANEEYNPLNHPEWEELFEYIDELERRAFT